MKGTSYTGVEVCSKWNLCYWGAGREPQILVQRWRYVHVVKVTLLLALRVEICRKANLNSNTGANPGKFSMGGRRKSKK